MERSKIEQVVREHVISQVSIGGASFASLAKIVTATGRELLLKVAPNHDMLKKEFNGLKELEKSGAIRVPGYLEIGDGFLLMEFIREGQGDSNFFEVFGRNLAELHRFSAPVFGFREDNYIGSSPQVNIAVGRQESDWASFYFSNRLLFQFRLAERNGYVDERFQRLFVNIERKLHTILAGSEEPPSLLHGDLWGGNFIRGDDGRAVLIDPAVYYGHREAEIAMTKLFGGFSPLFHEAYNEAYPLKQGYDYREPLYKLYHVLNHLNIFGGGYRREAINLMEFYQ